MLVLTVQWTKDIVGDMTVVSSSTYGVEVDVAGQSVGWLSRLVTVFLTDAAETWCGMG